MSDDKCCKRRMQVARAYLLRLQGYEEATAILKNRYLYALYEQSPDTEYHEAEYRDMERQENMIRKDLFRLLRSIDNNFSREVLWQLYIERKQPDEAAKWLGITVNMVRELQREGLLSLEVPDDFF